mgnify:FL=1|jgi:glyoxylase-like metal-dependent hydrolase (beta-lactamase superfamily II)
MIVQPCNAFSENTVLLPDGEGGLVVIDPGYSSPEEWNTLDTLLAAEGLRPTAVLLTHAHLDHVMGCHGMERRWGLRPRMDVLDLDTYAMAPPAAALYGVSLDPLPQPLEAGFSEGEELAFGKLKLTVRHAPGHAPGHVVFIDDEHQRVIGGDVLFQGSIGRTDLPGGDPGVLRKSIEEVLYTLPDHYTVVPGHGPTTTIGAERAANPFVNAAGSGMLQQG